MDSEQRPTLEEVNQKLAELEKSLEDADCLETTHKIKHDINNWLTIQMYYSLLKENDL
jgi:hypothetical protein